MTQFANALPEAVRGRAQSLGDAGEAWLQGLDEQVSQLCERWRLSPQGVMAGGSAALVVDVLAADSAAAVLKLPLPDDSGLVSERRVLALADGRGYARLLHFDEESGALLLERLGKSVGQLVEGADAQLQAIVATLQASWVAMDQPQGLTTAAEKAVWLADFVETTWQRLGEPCERATIDQAIAYAREREAAYDPGASFMLHGDAHEENTLADPAHPGRFKFIDPEGLHGEKACDLATLMRDWNAPLLAGDVKTRALERCAWLAQATESSTQAVWQWGFIERVSTGLVMLEIGMDAEGRETLGIAEALTGTGP